MRLVLAVLLGLLAVACSRVQTSGPAWPKMADRETDGGESLEPRSSAAAAVAAGRDDDEGEAAPATPAVEPDGASSDDDKDADAAAPAMSGEPAEAESDEDIIITTDEIVIEIDDE